MDHPTHGTTKPSPCFELLSAIAAAIDLPIPATTDDQPRYYRLRSARADHVLAAIRAATDDHRDLEMSARILNDLMAGYPADGYAHLGTRL